MGKVILFSPVGGTDPISNDNFQDGAMIHISRFYKPDEIYLYCTSYVIENESKDHRYTYCLSKLYESMKKELNYKIIKRADLDEVYDFDVFYNDFREEITKIVKSLNAEDRLIINISSGTPAMKSSLVVLVTLGEIDAQLIQVTTPNKGINRHDHNGYDVEWLWENNIDNEEGAENRCKEIVCPSLVQLKNEEMIKRLVCSYDYSAALDIIDLMPESCVSRYKHAIDAAKQRLQLDFAAVESICKDIELDINIFHPIREPKYKAIYEYSLSLYIKYKRNEYADFIRAITPLILKLYALIIHKELKIDIYKFANNYKGWTWDKKKLYQNLDTQKWINVWNRKEIYDGKFDFGYIKSDHLLYILNEFCPDTELRTGVNMLRLVEEKIRNTAAHEISAITPKRVLSITGYSCEDIIDAIKKLYKYTNVNVDEEKWNSYDTMNKYIVCLISESAVF